MHHRPSGPPASARLTAAVARLRWHLRIRAGRHTRRLAVMVAGTAAVSTVLLAAPVVTAADWSSVMLDSSSSQTSTATTTEPPSAGSPPESSTAWPAPRSTTAAPAAPGTPEQSVAAADGAGAPAPAPVPSEQATTARSTTGPAPAGESTVAAAAPPVPAPAVAEAGAPPATTPPATATPATSTSATPEVLDPEAQVLVLVNQHRATAACEPLTGDEELAAVARAHSADMRDQNFFAHVNLAGDDPFDRASRAGITARAENIAKGQRDAAAVVDGWMNSAGHRANILDCSLDRLGVGMAVGAGGPWWTQLFG